MNDQEIRDYDMFVRVDDCMTENLADFPAGSLARQKHDILKEAIAEFKQQGAAEESGASASKSYTQIKREARERLRKLLDAIIRTDRRMAQGTPGMKSHFRLPRTNGDQAFINAARAVAADAVPLKAQYIKWEMPETFLEDLNEAIEDFEEAVNKKNTSTSRRTQANAAIDEARRKGKEAVRDLDPIVRNKYRDNPVKLAAWEKASRTERPPRAKKKKETATATK